MKDFKPEDSDEELPNEDVIDAKRFNGEMFKDGGKEMIPEDNTILEGGVYNPDTNTMD